MAEWVRSSFRELRTAITETIIEVPSYSRLLMQDSSAGATGSIAYSLNHLYRTNPTAVDFFVGIGMVLSGAYLIDRIIPPLADRVGTFIAQHNPRLRT